MATARGSGTADEQATLERARRGEPSAFADLYGHHATMTWRLALVAGRSPSVASGALVDAFARVLGPSDRVGPGRSTPVRVQLLHAARGIAMEGGARPASAADELEPLGPPATTDEIVAAFGQLPERWRSVLWLREVERLDIREVGAILGMTVASADQLATRAFAGLREQLVQAQVRGAEKPDCQRTALRLSGYVAGALTDREEIRVRRHLDRCEACRTRLDEVDDLAPRLRRHVRPLPITLGAAAAAAWLTRTNDARGPLGLHLPGGAPMPAWAERSLAGAAAAFVTLGITTAVLLGARSGGNDDPTGPRLASEEPMDSSEGESALGDLAPGTDPVGAGGIDTPPTPAAADAPDDAGADAAPTSRGTTPTTVPPDPDAPPTPRPSAGPTTPPPSSPPTTVPPAPDSGGVVDAVDDALEPLDVCTGVGALDDLTGCDDAEDTGPLGGLL